MVSLSIATSKENTIKSYQSNLNSQNYSKIRVSVEGYIERALLEFDLSSLIDVPIENISTAVVECYAGAISNSRTLDFRRIDDNAWNTSTITWNTWISGGHTTTDYNIEELWTTEQTEQVNIKSMILDALRDGHDYLGIYIRFLDESDDDIFHNIELQSAPGPHLKIEYDTYSQALTFTGCCKNLLREDGWGEITMTDHNCSGGGACDAATFTFKTKWGATDTLVLLSVGDTEQYDSGVMHHSFKLVSIVASSALCDSLASATVEEKYWEDDCYVKTDGDNDRNGRSWAEAWKTVDQAANKAFDGQEVHIGFGNYNAEPAGNEIAPVNFGTTGIKYTPETATTGGGTGSVTVEKN